MKARVPPLAPLALLVALLAGGAHAGPPKLSADQLSELRDGEVLVIERTPTNNEGVAARAIGLVDFPPAKVWPVITDCANYHKYMPRTVKSAVRGETPGGHLCFIEIDMPPLFDNLWSLVDAKNTANPDGSYRRHWLFQKGTYSHNIGSWELFPFDGGQKTLLVYNIDVNPDVTLPDWVIASAQTGALPDLFEAVAGETKRRR